MNRLHRLLVLVGPALIAGAVIANATLGEAQPTPTPTPAPVPPVDHPRHPRAVVVDGDTVLPQEARDRIRAELDRALAEVDRDQDLPPKVRARVHRALEKARAASGKDLTKLGTSLQEMSIELQGLGGDLAGQVPGIQQEIDRALRGAGIHGKAGRIAVGPDGSDDPWAAVVAGDGDGDDDQDAGADSDDDQDVDVDVGNGSIRVHRNGRTITVPSPWMRGWQGPIPPVPPMPPVPPVPPMPPMPPGIDPAGPDGPDLSDALDPDIDLDLDDVKLTTDQARDLRKLASDVARARGDSEQHIADLSAELRHKIEQVDVNDAEVGALVDAITSEEAKLRKARLLGLIHARKLLTADQRGKVERDLP